MRGSLCVMCVYESLSVCVSMSAAGEGLHWFFGERSSAQASQTPDQAVTAQLIVVSICAAGKGEAACTPPGNLTEKSELD